MAIKSVNKAHRCPICNHADWCGIMSSDFGNDMYVCQRNKDTLKPGTGGVIGADGLYYVCVGISKNGGNNIFQEAEIYKQELGEKKIQRTDSDVTFKKSTSRIQRPLTPVNIVDPLPDNILHKMNLALLDQLILEPRHRDYLRNEGWSDELIDAYRIKSFPEEDYIRFKNKDSAYQSKNPWRVKLGEKLSAQFNGSLAGMPGAYLNKKEKWTFSPRAGILFPLPNFNRQIYRLRIRLDNATSSKYRNFSSYKIDEEAEKQGFLVNMYHMGCQSGNQLGFYCNPERDDMYIAYLTEGEKKGIIGNHILRAPVISVPGVNSYAKLVEGKYPNRPIDALKRMGVKILVIAFDADKTKNEAVMACQQNVINLLKDEGFLLGLAEWDMARGKGLDDLLVNGYKPTYVLA